MFFFYQFFYLCFPPFISSSNLHYLTFSHNIALLPLTLSFTSLQQLSIQLYAILCSSSFTYSNHPLFIHIHILTLLLAFYLYICSYHLQIRYLFLHTTLQLKRYLTSSFAHPSPLCNYNATSF